MNQHPHLFFMSWVLWWTMNMRGEMSNETPFVKGNSSVHESKISSGMMFVGLHLDRIRDVQNLEDMEWIVVGWCHLIPIIGWCRPICFSFFDGGIVQGIYISPPLFIEELMPIAILIAIWMWPWINHVARDHSMLISPQNSPGLWRDTCSTCVSANTIYVAHWIVLWRMMEGWLERWTPQ